MELNVFEKVIYEGAIVTIRGISFDSILIEEFRGSIPISKIKKI